MKKTNFLREYRDIFRANVYDGKRMEENLNGIKTMLMLLAIFCFIMTISYFTIGDYRMMVSSIILFLLFTGTHVAGVKTSKSALPLVVCMLGVMAVFTNYICSGSNYGFSILWTLLAPMFIMSTLGVKAGTAVGAYFQSVLFIIFWTPLRSHVADFYSPTFMNHFPILYLCTLITSMTIMLSHKKQQIALDRYQDKLEQAVRDEHNRATQITFQTIGAIIGLIDAKDPYTDDHSLRVAQYSFIIADEMGWERDAVEKLYYIALLHDIGKVGVHDSILKKKSRLSDSEYHIMKMHTSIGATILSEMTFLDNVDEGALYHHEKYDGSGYPFGLKGEEIPITARIICLADSFDAMNTARVYREKCDKAYIIDEIMKCRGTQFDPDVVDAFFRCIEKNRIVFSA